MIHTFVRTGVDPDTGIDFDAHYRVRHYPGVAFYLVGYQTEWTEETYVLDCPEMNNHVCTDDCPGYVNESEEIERTDMVRAIMVGDDTIHIVDIEDLTVIDSDDVCSCGQIGCWCPNNTNGG